ncbi:hypothetical protein ACFWOX_33190 [Streptomyces sp. NPDC058467]|uniref:phage integrase central domain-containing protein n=1 Tax=unclassified Streptomyces TaxID=2593676 RepID=UPI00366065E6
MADGTWRNYESFLPLHLIPALGSKTVIGVQTKDIQTFVAAISRKLAPSTIADRMKMVSSIFKTAIKEKRRPDNPTDDIKLPRTGAQAVDEDEIPTLHEIGLHRETDLPPVPAHHLPPGRGRPAHQRNPGLLRRLPPRRIHQGPPSGELQSTP